MSAKIACRSKSHHNPQIRDSQQATIYCDANHINKHIVLTVIRKNTAKKAANTGLDHLFIDAYLEIRFIHKPLSHQIYQ